MDNKPFGKPFGTQFDSSCNVPQDMFSYGGSQIVNIKVSVTVLTILRSFSQSSHSSDGKGFVVLH